MPCLYGGEQTKNNALKQLKKWNVKYNKVFFGKPSFDILVDDKSLSFRKEWIFDLKKKLY
jgi:hypothetical protein